MSAVLLLIGALLAVWIGLICAVQICTKKKRTARRSDCLIVLGAKVHPDGRLSHTLQYRCAAAAEAFQQGIAPTVIVCGGQGKDEPLTEADAMRAELVRLGVPERAILTEGISRNTKQNLENAKRLMERRGYRRCAVVTSDYHVARALWTARDLQMDACGIPSRTARTLKRFFKTRITESLSWIKYGLTR